MLRSVLGWLRHFTPKLHSTNTAFYNGVRYSMKLQLFFILICFFVAGCASTKKHPYEVWKSLETPSSFSLGEHWVFIILNHEGEIKQKLVVNFTGDTASTCASGEWKKIEIINEYPSRNGSYRGSPAYYLKGAALIIDLSANLCDAGYELKGQLQETGIVGEHYPVSMFGGEVQGMFYGVPVGGT